MKRKVISCVLAGASVFSLVCINGGNLVAKADGDVTEIRFTEWDGGDTLAVYEEIAEKFNESHPDIHVTVMNVPDEYDTKITAMIAGNDIPEVCMMNSDKLKHQRRSSHDGNVDFKQVLQHRIFRHPAKRNHKAQRQRKDQRQEKNPDGPHHASGKL